MVNSYVIDSPQPSNISYWWNFGSLLALCLVIQILSGVTLAMVAYLSGTASLGWVECIQNLLPTLVVSAKFNSDIKVSREDTENKAVLGKIKQNLLSFNKNKVVITDLYELRGFVDARLPKKP